MMRGMGALGILCLLTAGCVSQQERLRIAEETEKQRDLDIAIIGDVTDLDSVALMKVQSVGLVTGLAGTGHCPNGYYRTLLEQHILKNMGPRGGEIAEGQQHARVRDLLDNPDNALVIVTGYIPKGARKGDRFDVEITLPAGSKTTSLAGGFLQKSFLRVYEAAANLSERHVNSNQLIGSQVFAQATGSLIVGLGNNRDTNELKHARIWQGGISHIDRPYSFVMKTDDKSIRHTNAVAERINHMFQDDPQRRAMMREEQKYLLLVGNVTDQLNVRANAGGLQQKEMAKPVSKQVINIRVPFAYRHNHERYIRVARLTPLRENDQTMLRYQERLRKMLQDPHDALRASLRLEALGRDSIPILKEGLESPHSLVRFVSAEALAYLGSTAGVDTLTQLARENLCFTSHSVNALANLNETVCRDRLAELMIDKEPAVRNAAFHGLCLIDDEDPRLGGMLLNKTFWFYRVPQAPASMVSVSSSKRAQVIFFGRNILVEPETRLIFGAVSKDFTLVVSKDDDTSVVKRITAQGEQQRPCSRRLDEVLIALTDMGATYPDIVDFLHRAHDDRKLNCPVVNWTTPEISLENLIEATSHLK